MGRIASGCGSTTLAKSPDSRENGTANGAVQRRYYPLYRTPSKRRFSATENRNTTASKARRRRQRGGPNKQSSKNGSQSARQRRSRSTLTLPRSIGNTDRHSIHTASVQTCQTNINKSDENILRVLLVARSGSILAICPKKPEIVCGLDAAVSWPFQPGSKAFPRHFHFLKTH